MEEFIYPYYAKEAADEVLEEWDDVCKELGVTHFLVLGTCLGFVRDKRWIKSDSDIDVGILGNLDNVKKKLMEQGFVVVPTPEIHLRGNKHFCKRRIFLDVWYSHEPRFIKSFDKVTYNGRIYNVPHPVEGYLEAAYPVSKYKVSWMEPV